MRAAAEDLQRLLGGFAANVDTIAIARAIDGRDRRALRRLLREAWETVGPGLAARLEVYVVEVTTTRYGAAWAAVTKAPYTPPTRAIDHARRQAGRRVTAMTKQSRGVIGRLVTAAVSGRASNQQLARELVTAGLGLDLRRARALSTFHGVLQAAVADGRTTPETAAKRLVRRAGRLVRSRSRTIARTETAEARGYARQAAWNDAIRRKVIREKQWEKVWHANLDELTSDPCIELNGQTTGVRGAFADGYRRPPRHPNCRCSCTIRRKR